MPVGDLRKGLAFAVLVGLILLIGAVTRSPAATVAAALLILPPGWWFLLRVPKPADQGMGSRSVSCCHYLGQAEFSPPPDQGRLAGTAPEDRCPHEKGSS